MGKIPITWAQVDISLREIANELGYDLHRFDKYPRDTQDSIIVLCAAKALEILAETWEENEFDYFKNAQKAVYIVSLADRLCIKYSVKGKVGYSSILYIGKGKIKSRIESHLKGWIFNLSRSLSDISLRFYMTSVVKQGSSKFHSDLEAALLHRFKELYGEIPLKNKRRENGRSNRFAKGWSSPIGKNWNRYVWSIEPRRSNQFFKKFGRKIL